MKTAVCISFVCIGFSLPVFARTITVNPEGGGDFPAIQAAIDAAEDGDIVLVAPGVYVITEPIDFNRRRDPEDPPPLKNLTLRSEAGPDRTAIQMAGKLLLGYPGHRGEEPLCFGFP